MAAFRSVDKRAALSWARHLKLREHSFISNLLQHTDRLPTNSSSYETTPSDNHTASQPLSFFSQEGLDLGGRWRTDCSSSAQRNEVAQYHLLAAGRRSFATSAVRKRTVKSTAGPERVAGLPVEVLTLKRSMEGKDLPRVDESMAAPLTSGLEKLQESKKHGAKRRLEAARKATSQSHKGGGLGLKAAGDLLPPQADGSPLPGGAEGEDRGGGAVRSKENNGGQREKDTVRSKQGLGDLWDSSKIGVAMTPQERETLALVLKRFQERGWAADQALALYVNSKLFPMAMGRFKRFVLKGITRELLDSILALGPCDSLEEDVLFPLFAEFVVAAYADDIRIYRGLVQSADMTRPDAWYPMARNMVRKIFYHHGPTNSGKTYNALQSFKAAESAIYCGPLRLLAMEIYDRVNAEGLSCSLHTGQERRIVPGARHVSCTVEMADFEKPWDVAVIDEIQMINNSHRGWAWTRSLLGVTAKEVHVCGDGSALPLFHSLCAATGEELVEQSYDRHTPLHVEKESLRGRFERVKAGDCVVVFSRRDIFQVKALIEKHTKYKCCVIYGALPPETRWQQASLFNDADSEYKVLVASDAIGMGLNLNIKRVVFYAVDKYDGTMRSLIPPPMVKQIAGRAGRRGSLYQQGSVTTFHPQDLSYLRHCLTAETEFVSSAGLFPVFEQVELFAGQLPEISYDKLLDRFADVCKTDGSYFLCRYDNLRLAARQLEDLKNLTLEERYRFCLAPVNIGNDYCNRMFQWYARGYSERKAVPLGVTLPEDTDSEFDLLEMEAKHQVVSMYLWLSQYFDAFFTEREKAQAMAVQIAKYMAASLARRSKVGVVKNEPTFGGGKALDAALKKEDAARGG